MQALQDEKLNHFKYGNEILVRVVKCGRFGPRMKQLPELLNKSVKICNYLPLLQYSQGFSTSLAIREQLLGP